MIGPRWRALFVAIIAATALGLGLLAVFASPRLAGIILTVLVLVLALLLYRELEHGARLRDRTAHTEQQLETKTTELERAETTDPMTKLANRLRLFERLQEEFRRSARYGRPLACVLLDLDRFSWINDQYGEHFGDTVLAEFATVLASDLRDTDLAVRYEGEAFALLLPETPASQAATVAERIRQRLKEQVFSDGVVACSLTASFGIAGLPDPRIKRIDDLVHLAGQALADAKRRGRDRVHADLPPTTTGSDLHPVTGASPTEPFPETL